MIGGYDPKKKKSGAGPGAKGKKRTYKKTNYRKKHHKKTLRKNRTRR